MLATPKGVPTPPPQGQNSVSNPCGGFFAQKGKSKRFTWLCETVGRSASLPASFAYSHGYTAGIWDDRRFSPGHCGRNSNPCFHSNSHLQSCFWGRFTPCFSADFRLVSGFSEAGGILTLPQRKKRHTGATAAFAVFHSSGVYCFRSVFPATNRDFPSAATTF